LSYDTIHYSDNPNNMNFVINLIFLRPNLIKINNHSILPESQHSLDYISLIVDLFIIKEFIQEKQYVRVGNDRLSFILFSFFFLILFLSFYFFFFISGHRQRRGYVMSQISHSHNSPTVMCHMEKCRKFWKNDIIQHI